MLPTVPKVGTAQQGYCKETFGTEQGGHVLDGDLDFQLRVVLMGHPIFRGISPSMEELNPVFHDRIIHAIDLYKEIIRPLLPGCRVRHHTGMLPLFDLTPCCVLEYASANKARCVIGLFRTGEIGDDDSAVHPRGLDVI